MNKFNKLLLMFKVIPKWWANYIINYFTNSTKPVHIFFCLCDHYEPGTGGVSKKIEIKRVNELLHRYPAIAKNHRDFKGNIPRRTWFFPPHYHRYNNLKNLVSLCEEGYGEIELHLHHGKNRPDTEKNLRETLLQCINEYSEFGIFGELNGEKKYGFIHGDWALNNSRSGKYCGVNNEIKILRETGCYADFTFPSMNEANPKKINKIFYAYANSHNPKSHNTGNDVIKNGNESGDLMIIQGPICPIFLSKNISGLRCVGDVINGKPPVTKERINAWINTWIFIKGQKNMIVIKTHTHGATDSDVVLGKEIEYIFSYLEANFNDGDNFRLHYVTARELYNIIKGIESGRYLDDPELCRDYLINKPRYDSSPTIPNASDYLFNLVSKTYTISRDPRA